MKLGIFNFYDCPDPKFFTKMSTQKKLDCKPLFQATAQDKRKLDILFSTLHVISSAEEKLVMKIYININT